MMALPTSGTSRGACRWATRATTAGTAIAVSSVPLSEIPDLIRIVAGGLAGG